PAQGAQRPAGPAGAEPAGGGGAGGSRPGAGAGGPSGAGSYGGQQPSGGYGGQQHPTPVAPEDDMPAEDDADLDESALSGHDLIVRELGATVIEEIANE
ncbi:DNA polymerase III subunit gamma and tau, partial [Streptomyces sp. 796.1]